MRPIEPNVEPNNDPRCAHRETTTGLTGAPLITQIPPMAELYCGVQVERDGRHAILHAPDCDGARCGIDLIELLSDHDPRAYDHLCGAPNVVQFPACRTSYAIGSTPYPYNPTAHVDGCDCSAGARALRIPAHLLMNDPAAEAARVAAAYEAMLADPGTPNWPGVLLAAARLYTELTGRTFPTPDVDDTPEDAARARLGKLGAAIGLELLHYVIDTDDEQPLEAAAAELREHGDIPESVVVAMAPVVASVLNAAIDAIETARKHEDETP